MTVTLVWAAEAGSGVASKQRIVIHSTDTQYAFSLVPATAGAVRRDSGTITWGDPRQRFVRRDGQLVEVNDVSATFTGNRGTFEIRFRTDWTNAGHGYSIGTSQWSLLRGTGPYSPLRASGRGSSIWPPHGFPFFRLDGLVDS
jgi:hypothetical protein